MPHAEVHAEVHAEPWVVDLDRSRIDAAFKLCHGNKQPLQKTREVAGWLT